MRHHKAARVQDGAGRAAHKHPSEMTAEETKMWSEKIEKLKRRYKTAEDHEYDDEYWDEAGEHAGVEQEEGLDEVAKRRAGVVGDMAERLREVFHKELQHEHGGAPARARDGARDEKWLEEHHAEDEYEDEKDYYEDATKHHLKDADSPIKCADRALM